MIKHVPLLDATTGQQFALTGETTDIVPSDRTVYIDRHGNTYDPTQRKVSFDELPQDGVMELPRTTWWTTSDDDPILDILPDGTIVATQVPDLAVSCEPLQPMFCFCRTTPPAPVEEERE